MWNPNTKTPPKYTGSVNNTDYGNGNHNIDLGDGRFQLLTYPPISNTNTIAPICPQYSHLYLNYCVSNHSVCPPGTAQDKDDITCSPIKQNQERVDLSYDETFVNQLPGESVLQNITINILQIHPSKNLV
jgi:hypothetical protein